MDFADFVEGPLLWIVFLAFLAALTCRLFLFGLKIFKTQGPGRSGSGYTLVTFARFFLPFHMALAKKPIYSLLRYVFHLCLFIVPIWLSGHIVLWSESRLEWEWEALPDSWADWMTLFVLAAALYFLIRRAALSEHRKQSSGWDYLIIVLAALPFLSGYFLTHGTLDGIAFFDARLRTIHAVTGVVMILMAAFLFVRTRLNADKCTGCASCELSCPTGTLQSKDQDSWRIFTYSHYQCICCGSCVNTCPEDAAQMRHELSIKRFFHFAPREEIRRAELKACLRCGAKFMPEPLYAKVCKTFPDECIQLCPNCRKVNIGELYRKLSPWHARSGSKAGRSPALQAQDTPIVQHNEHVR